MTQGRLIAVVGPSGVGKDSVMAGLQRAVPDLHMVRRVITRPAELGGEDYDAVTDDQFDARLRDGAFALHWGAHGLQYGVPIDVKQTVAQGRDCLVNLSRSVLVRAADIFLRFTVLHVTAQPETLAHRLMTRGREDQDQITKRLAQAVKPLPAGLNIVELPNDGLLDETIARGVSLLQLAKAP